MVFCSKGDNITPPQQALGWILDLYDDVDQIRSYGQTIVYTIHETTGHLGIFVSSGVARKEHGEFSSNIDLIDTLPPGLYEAVFEEKTADVVHPDLVTGQWVMRCEERTLDNIRALGGNDPEDERRFATAARVSETNLGLYRTFAQPAVRAMTTSQMAQSLHRLHPLRLQYEMFSDANPFMAPVAALAEQVRKNRKLVSDDNPFWALQTNMSRQVVSALDAWRDATEAAAEETFLSTYGSPTLQAAAGIDARSARPLRKAGKNSAALAVAADESCRTEIANRERRPARRSRPQRAFHRNGSRVLRRACVRACPSHASDRRRHATPFAGGVQGARSRAVFHVAH